MNIQQAGKQAAKESKGGDVRFVVYVPDQGREVYNFEQMEKYAGFVFLEAEYVDGRLFAKH